MKFLLDTHTFLWFIGGDNQLSLYARNLIAEIENDIFLSSASLWEIALKTSIGKLDLGKPFDELIPEQLITNEITLLPIGIQALSVLTKLPFHHRDPFDRLLIAQSIAEKLPIISKDNQFSSYSIDLIWQRNPPITQL